MYKRQHFRSSHLRHLRAGGRDSAARTRACVRTHTPSPHALVAPVDPEEESRKKEEEERREERQRENERKKKEKEKNEKLEEERRKKVRNALMMDHILKKLMRNDEI